MSPNNSPAYYTIRTGKIAAVGCISGVIIGLVILLVAKTTAGGKFNILQS